MSSRDALTATPPFHKRDACRGACPARQQAGPFAAALAFLDVNGVTPTVDTLALADLLVAVIKRRSDDGEA